MKTNLLIAAALCLSVSAGADAAISHLGNVPAENLFDLTLTRQQNGAHNLLREYGQVTVDTVKPNYCYQVQKTMVITDLTIDSIVANPAATQFNSLHLFGYQGANGPYTIFTMRPTHSIDHEIDEATATYTAGFVMPAGSTLCMYNPGVNSRFNWMSFRMKGYYPAK